MGNATDDVEQNPSPCPPSSPPHHIRLYNPQHKLFFPKRKGIIRDYGDWRLHIPGNYETVTPQSSYGCADPTWRRLSAVPAR